MKLASLRERGTNVSMKMRFIALIVATLLITLGWFALAFKPAQSKLGEVRTEVKRTQDEVASLTAKLEHLQELKRDEKKLRAEAKKFDDALPTNVAVSNFIRDVQDASKEAGIDFLTVAPSLPTAPKGAAAPAPAAPTSGDAAAAQPPAPVPSLQAISVSLTATGQFFEIENFVSKMERLDRAIRIDTFGLSGGGGETGPGGSPALSLTVQLQMFLNKPAPAAAAPAPAASGATTSGS